MESCIIYKAQSQQEKSPIYNFPEMIYLQYNQSFQPE
jgi:hypothetical protein